MYQTQISLLLGLDDRSIVSICKTVCPKYGPPPTKTFKFSSEITKPVVVHDGKSSKENVPSTQSKEKPSSLVAPASRVSESPEIRFPLDYLLPIKKLKKCHELTYQKSAANPDDCPPAPSTHRESPDEPAMPPAIPAPESTSLLPIVSVSTPADPPATNSIAARPDDCPPASLTHRRESPDEPARPPAVSAPESTSMLPAVSLSTPAGSSPTISSAASIDDGPPASSIHRRESLDEPARSFIVPAPESTSMGPVVSVATPWICPRLSAVL